MAPGSAPVAEQVRGHLPRSELFIYAFRYVPTRLATAGDEVTTGYLDRLNQDIADRLQLSGEAFVMTSRIRGRLYLRLSICSHRTRLEEMDRVLQAVRFLGSELSRQE